MSQPRCSPMLDYPTRVGLMRKRPPHHEAIWYFYTHPGRWGASDIMNEDEQRAFAFTIGKLVRSGYSVRDIKDAMDRFYATKPTTPLLRTFMGSYQDFMQDAVPVANDPKVQLVLEWLRDNQYRPGLPWTADQNDELATFLSDYCDEAVFTYPGLVATILSSDDPVRGSGDWSAFEVPLNLLNYWVLFAHGEINTFPGVPLKEWRSGKKYNMRDRLFSYLDPKLHTLIPEGLFTRSARPRNDDLNNAIALDLAHLNKVGSAA